MQTAVFYLFSNSSPALCSFIAHQMVQEGFSRTDMIAEVLTEKLSPVVQRDTRSSNLKISSIVFVCI